MTPRAVNSGKYLGNELWGFQQIVTREELGLGSRDILSLEYVPELGGYRFHISVIGKRKKLEEAVSRLSMNFQHWARRVREVHHTQ